MRIHNNYTSQAFTSKNDIRKKCIETMDEFNKEFTDVKCQYKTYRTTITSKCEGKYKLYLELMQVQYTKLNNLKDEFEDFQLSKPSYQEKMIKLKELMLKHKIANCEEFNTYYQYMLAKKGVYSERIGFDINVNNNGMNRNEDHLFLRIKNNTHSSKSFIADSFLNTVTNENKYLKLARNFFIAKDLNYKDYEHVEPINGYNEFLSESTQASKSNRVNCGFRLPPKVVEFLKRIRF